MVSDYRNSLTPPRPFLRLWRNVRRGQLTPPHLFRIGRYGTVWRFSLPQWDLAGDRICIQQQLVALICFHDEPCSMGMRISMGYAVLKSGANVCNGSTAVDSTAEYEWLGRVQSRPSSRRIKVIRLCRMPSWSAKQGTERAAKLPFLRSYTSVRTMP